MKKLFFLLLMFCSSLVFSQTDSTKVDKFKETDKVLAKILDKSLVVAEKTGQFVIEQAPDVLREFYIWHTAKHIFWVVFAIGFFLFCRYIPYLWLNKNKDEFNSYRDGWYFARHGEAEMVCAWFVFGIGLLISILIGAKHLYELIFVLVSPKLYLIEYLMSLRQS